MSTDQLTRAQHVDLPAEPVRVAERPLVRAAMLVVGLVVVVALPWRTCPIVLPSIPQKGSHHQTVGSNT